MVQVLAPPAPRSSMKCSNFGALCTREESGVSMRGLTERESGARLGFGANSLLLPNILGLTQRLLSNEIAAGQCVEAMYKRSHASARVRNNWPHRHKCSSESWPLFSSCPSSWNKVALKVCLTMWLNTSQPCACTHQALIMVNSYCSQLAQEL